MAFVRTAAGFVAGFVVAAAVAMVIFGAGRGGAGGADESAAESLATAIYLLIVTSLPAAAGFAAVTCVTKRWRELPRGTLFALAAAGGFLCYAALLTGVAGVFAVVVPFPLGAVGAAVRFVVPGAVLGLLAVAASAWRARGEHISQS